jgi:tetratricopeptide (TPR) repeat protein
MRLLFSILTLCVLGQAAAEFNAAAEKLQQVLEITPDDGASHYQLGVLLMDNDGDAVDAATHFERAAELQFQPLGAAYRLSRLYARSGNIPGALSQIEILSDGGFGQINLLEDESDYDSIRGHPRFEAALIGIRAARFPCAADERHHAFDFWIGKWTVTQNGQFAGTNNIQPILGHCTLLEQWESATGSLGKSFNYYDPGEDHWRQIWISDSGSFVEFTGKARDGGIFYKAETTNPADGSVTLHRFDFTQLDDGVVRQFWQTSSDNGETWTTIWDGRYSRLASE